MLDWLLGPEMMHSWYVRETLATVWAILSVGIAGVLGLCLLIAVIQVYVYDKPWRGKS